MKKIGLLNFHYSNNNYGAVIQAYCLQEIIKSLGYQSTTINYLNLSKNPFRAYKQLLFKYSSKNPFERFRKENLKTSTIIPYNPFLFFCNFYFDTYIVGSDQVWRYFEFNNVFKNFTYYLDFSFKNKNKISYAASFGLEKWPNEVPEKINTKIKKLINKFDRISIREAHGVEICKEIFDVNAIQVLDPTLLIDPKYLINITNDNLEDRYKNKISYYKLDKDNNFNSLINKISKQRKLNNINLYKKDNGEFREIDFFLSLIRFSKTIVTDSFHCICFALVFNVDFIYYPNKERGLSRVQSLFESLSIDQSRIYDGTNVDEYVKMLKPLNFHEIHNKLDIFKSTSLRFLNSAILKN